MTIATSPFEGLEVVPGVYMGSFFSDGVFKGSAIWIDPFVGKRVSGGVVCEYTIRDLTEEELFHYLLKQRVCETDY